MSVPIWFEKDAYFNNKLAELGEGWDVARLRDAFEQAGYSTDAEGLYKHFQDFGNAENVSPSSFFNVPQYLASKADQLNAMEDGKGFEGHQWDEASVLAAIKAAGLTVWDHYTQYGMYEGVNPSNQFDTSDYLAAKLLQLKADDPAGNWTEAKMLDAFREAGLNPVQHEALYGRDEGVSVSPVPAGERVITDFDPYTPSTPGTTYTLTTGPDVISGTPNDDVITGVASSLTGERTLNPEDVIDGGAGNDTLKVDLQSTFSGFSSGSMVNVEKVVLSNEGNIARTFSAKGSEGVETYSLHAGGAAVNLADLDHAGVTVNVLGQEKGATSIGFTADAVKGENDSLTLGLNNVGTAATESAAAQYVGVSAAGIENLAVQVTDDNYVDLTNVSGAKTISVSGPGDLDVRAVAAGVTSVDASTLTGDLTADLSAATISALKGGAGDDTFTVDSLAPNAVLEGGAGEDTLVLSNLNATLKPTLSGFENITASGGALVFSGKNVSDFTSLTVENNATVILSDVDAPAFSVTASGVTGGNVTLADATVLTYNTEASGNTTATQAVSTTVDAAKATSATVNIGAYTSQTGGLNLLGATDVTVNVASGLGDDGTEQTSFAATLTASKAQSLNVHAEGLLGASRFQVDQAQAVNLDAAQGSTGPVNIQAAKATDVTLAAGGDLNIAGSNFGNAQSVILTQNKGALSGAVAFAKLNQLTVSGADASSAVTLGALGDGSQDYSLTVDASGLQAGFEAGAIDAGSGDVALQFAAMTGEAETGNIAGANVSVQASELGMTHLGDIAASGDVHIDALGMLGGGKDAAATDDALAVGNIAADGAVTVKFDGANDVSIGTIAGKSLSLDASAYLGSIAAAGAGSEASIGAITADTAVIKGAEIGANSFASIIANMLTYTGGLGVDTVSLTAKSGTALTATLDTGVGDDVVTLAGITGNAENTTTSIKVIGDMGGDTGDTITVTTGNVSSASTIDLSGLTGYATGTITAGFTGSTLIGGSGNDTITAKSDAYGTADTLTGGAGDDKFVVGVATSGDTVTDGATAIITDFGNGTDTIKIGALAAGSSTNYAEDTTTYATLEALVTAATGMISADVKYVAAMLGNDTYLVAGGTPDEHQAIIQLQGVSLDDLADNGSFIVA